MMLYDAMMMLNMMLLMIEDVELYDVLMMLYDARYMMLMLYDAI